MLHWKKSMLTKQPTPQNHNVEGAKTKTYIKFYRNTEQGKVYSALAECESTHQDPQESSEMWGPSLWVVRNEQRLEVRSLPTNGTTGAGTFQAKRTANATILKT